MVIGLLLTFLDSCTCHRSGFDDQKLGDFKLVGVFQQHSAGIVWTGSCRDDLD